MDYLEQKHIEHRIHMLEIGVHPAHRQQKVERKLKKLWAMFWKLDAKLTAEYIDTGLYDWNRDDNTPYPDIPEECPLPSSHIDKIRNREMGLGNDIEWGETNDYESDLPF